MAKLVALETLRNDALARADMANSGLSVAEVNGYVNKAYAKYYDELIKSDAMYNVAQQSITTCLSTDPAAVSVAGVQQLDTYKLPADFYETKGLDVNLGGQQMLTARRINWHDRNVLKFWGTTGWFFGQAVCYYLRDGFMIYVPIPQAAFTVTHWYYPVARTMAADTDTVDVLNGGDDFIALATAMQLARKEESWDMYGSLKGDLGEEMGRVQAMAPKRDAAEPPRVTETSRRNVYRSMRGARY